MAYAPHLHERGLRPVGPTAAAVPGAFAVTAWGVRIASAIAILVGGFWLAAWLGGHAARWSAAGHLIPKANMAVGQLLAAVALLLLWRGAVVVHSTKPEDSSSGGHHPRLQLRQAGTLLALIALMIGALTLSEHLLQYDLGIDQLLATEAPGAAATASPNRIGPPGSACLVLLGVGLLALGWGRRAAVPYLGLAVCLINLVPAVGFLYGVGGFFSQARITGIAWPTVLALSALGLGLVVAQPDQGPVALLLRQDAGGTLLRRMLPAAILVPLVLGYLKREGESLGLYQATTGTGLLVIAVIVVLAFILWRSAARLSGQEAAARSAEAAIRSQAEVMDHAHDALIVRELGGIIRSWNLGAERLYGWSAAEAVGQRTHDLLHTPESSVQEIEILLGQTGRWQGELLHTTRDGRRVTVESRKTATRTEDGRVLVLESNRDITRRKQAEEELHRLSAAAQRERDRLSTLVNSITDEIWFADAEKQLTLVNPAVWREFGSGIGDVKEVEKIAAQFEVYRPDGTPRPVDEAPPLRALQGETVTGQEEIVRTPATGQLRHRQVSAAPVRDATGAIIGSVSVVRDITERKRAEEALRESEARLHVTLNSIGDAVLSVDTAGCVTFLNPVAVALTGWPLPEAVGQPIQKVFRIVDETSHQPGEDIVQRVLRERRVVALANHTVLVARDGREIAVEDSAAPIIDPNGDVAGVVLVFHDVSEKRRVQASLRESEARMQQALSVSRSFTFEWVPATDHVLRSDSCAMVLNLAGDEVRHDTGQRYFQRVHPDDRARFIRMLQALTPSADTYTTEYRVMRGDGGVVALEEVGQAAFDADGKLERLVGVTTDITARKLAEEALEKTKAAAEEANRQKDHFLAVLGHELRNPLAPISYSVALLKRLGPPDPALQRAHDVIDRQVVHMTRLIDDLLDVSRIARGKITLRKEELDLTDLVQRVLDDHRPLLEAHGLALNLTAPPRGTVRMLGDTARITQIVGNLLTNANKFTDRGGRVDVSLEMDGERHAVIRLRDTGIGIDRETLARLFQPFAQADRSMDRSGGGLGLGLALVKGLVDLHGGRVWATSTGTGHGAEFVVSLPGVVRGPGASSLQPAGTGRGASRPKRILIIEDNHDTAEALKVWLELSGHTVVVAHSAPEGLEEARSHAPEVILCDIGLPGMNGYELARAIRKTDDLAVVNLVAMTGYGQDEDRQRALDAGFDYHLTKPADPQALERLLAGA